EREPFMCPAPPISKEGALHDPPVNRRFCGLFTAYTVGNIASAQLAAAMEGSGVSLADAAARRDFSDVLGWLRENVHAPGLTVSVQEMLVRATGEPMNAEPYRKHIADRYLG